MLSRSSSQNPADLFRCEQPNAALGYPIIGISLVLEQRVCCCTHVSFRVVDIIVQMGDVEVANPNLQHRSTCAVDPRYSNDQPLNDVRRKHTTGFFESNSCIRANSAASLKEKQAIPERTVVKRRAAKATNKATALWNAPLFCPVGETDELCPAVWHIPVSKTMARFMQHHRVRGNEHATTAPQIPATHVATTKNSGNTAMMHRPSSSCLGSPSPYSTDNGSFFENNATPAYPAPLIDNRHTSVHARPP